MSIRIHYTLRANSEGAARASLAALHKLARERRFGFAGVSPLREYHGDAAKYGQYDVDTLDRELLVEATPYRKRDDEPEFSSSLDSPEEIEKTKAFIASLVSRPREPEEEQGEPGDVIGFRIDLEEGGSVGTGCGFCFGFGRFGRARIWRWSGGTDNLLGLLEPPIGSVERFVNRYKAVIIFLETAKAAGLVATIDTDDTEYLKHRSDARLAQVAKENLQSVMGLVGRLRDTFPGDNVEINGGRTAHPDFEYLEAEGRRAQGEDLLRAPNFNKADRCEFCSHPNNLHGMSGCNAYTDAAGRMFFPNGDQRALQYGTACPCSKRGVANA